MEESPSLFTLPEMILKNFDNQSLTKCLALCWLSKERKKLTKSLKLRTRQGTQRLLWVEIIQKYVGNIEKFPETWEKVIDKAPIEMLEKLALSVHEFFTFRQSRNEHQWNPLHIAAERGSLRLCEFIFEKIGKQNPSRSDDLTALHLSAQNGHLEVRNYVMSKWTHK